MRNGKQIKNHCATTAKLHKLINRNWQSKLEECKERKEVNRRSKTNYNNKYLCVNINEFFTYNSQQIEKCLYMVFIIFFSLSPLVCAIPFIFYCCFAKFRQSSVWNVNAMPICIGILQKAIFHVRRWCKWRLILDFIQRWNSYFCTNCKKSWSRNREEVKKKHAWRVLLIQMSNIIFWFIVVSWLPAITK